MLRKKTDNELTELEDEPQAAPDIAEETAAVEVAETDEAWLLVNEATGVMYSGEQDGERWTEIKPRERMPRRPCCANC